MFFFKLTPDYSIFQVDPKIQKKRRRANLVALTELSSISSGWTRAGFVGSNQTATPSLSLSFTLTHVVLQLLLFHTLSLSPSLLLLPVVRLRRPWFPLSLPSSRRIGGAPGAPHQAAHPSTPDPTASLPPTAARRPVHTWCKSAPTCTELYRVCVCVLACVRACLQAGFLHNCAHNRAP